MKVNWGTIEAVSGILLFIDMWPLGHVRYWSAIALALLLAYAYYKRRTHE